jgi:thiamine biosynthesis protein ThiI
MFIDKVNQLIKEKINNENVKLERNHDRLYIKLNGENHVDIIKGLDKVSGLSSYSLVTKTTTDLETVSAEALKVIEEELDGKEVTFKVETKRADKTYPLESLEISQSIARYVLRRTNLLKVDVHNPEMTLDIEIRRDGAYIFAKKYPGMGGFPVGVAGKGLLMVSGGIDSPVAGFLAMKQGVQIECIHFESTPLTSIESAQKVIDLTAKLAAFAPRNTIKLHMVPFEAIHQALLENIHESYTITVMRRMMYRISEKFAYKYRIPVILNGDSIGQVASQTLESMSVINNVVKLPIIRPLATYDKSEIIKISKRIDCFDISIKPFEDCCTVYVPKNPITKPREDRVSKQESYFDFDSLINKTLENIKTIEVKPSGNIDLSQHGFTVNEVL